MPNLGAALTRCLSVLRAAYPSGADRCVAHSVHLMRGFSQMPRIHSWEQAGE
jgi:hypothetical protein